MKEIKIVRNTDDPNLMGTVVVQEKDRATNIGFSKDSGIAAGEYDLEYKYDSVLKRRLWTIAGSRASFLPKVEYSENVEGIVIFAHPYIKGEDGKLIVAKCKADTLNQLNAQLRTETNAKLTITDIDPPGDPAKPPVVKHKKKHKGDPNPPAVDVLEDDLTKIDGLGKASEKLLKKSGVTTFKALADLAADELKELMVGHSKRMASVDTSKWAEQARAMFLDKEEILSAGKNAKKVK